MVDISGGPVDLTKEEKEVIIDFISHRIREIVMVARNNELIVNNPGLAKQYSDDYIKILKEKQLPDEYKSIIELKRFANKVAGYSYYHEDELR